MDQVAEKKKHLNIQLNSVNHDFPTSGPSVLEKETVLRKYTPAINYSLTNCLITDGGKNTEIWWSKR